MAFNNQSIYGNINQEPYKLKGKIPFLDENDTNYGLLDTLYQNTGDNLNFNTTAAESTGTQPQVVHQNPEAANINAGSYDNALLSLQETSTGQQTDRYGNTTYSGGNLGLMDTFDYADEVQPWGTDEDWDNEQTDIAMNRATENLPEGGGGVNWGAALSKGLMGYADALSNEYMYGGFGTREGNNRDRLMRGRPSQAYRMGSSY